MKRVTMEPAYCYTYLEVDLSDVTDEACRPLRQLSVALDSLADVWHKDRVDRVVLIHEECHLRLVWTHH